MLAIRMQRTGRKGHAMFRVVVQDSRRTPTSGRIVALLGSHDPHAKVTRLEKEKAAYYLQHGAQPSARVIRILQSEGVDLPNWVEVPSDTKKRPTRNQDKLRRNQPVAEKPVAQDETEAPAAEVTDTTIVAESEEAQTAK